MGAFSIAVAGASIGIRSRFESTREYFRAYLTDAAPDFIAEVTVEALCREQLLLNEEADREGLRRRQFTDPFLERSAIQRMTAAGLLKREILLLHGSTVAVDGAAYLFTAACGVGKSTHTRLWREYFGSRAVMVNDDRAFLKPENGCIAACGSPWSGKHGLDSNIQVPLAGICILRRGPENRIRQITAEEALPFLLEQVYEPEPGDLPQLRKLLEPIAKAVPLWQMECTKEPSAAETAYRAMSAME